MATPQLGIQWHEKRARGRRRWSVFGEPGGAIRFQSGEHVKDEFDIEPLQFSAGGRYHFTDTVTLTMRVGYPTFSIGVSFLL